jgi:hypothetical protein
MCRLYMITETAASNFGPKVPVFRFSSIIMDAQKPRDAFMSPRKVERPRQQSAPVIYNDFSEYEKQLRQYSFGY